MKESQDWQAGLIRSLETNPRPACQHETPLASGLIIWKNSQTLFGPSLEFFLFYNQRLKRRPHVDPWLRMKGNRCRVNVVVFIILQLMVQSAFKEAAMSWKQTVKRFLLSSPSWITFGWRRKEKESFTSQQMFLTDFFFHHNNKKRRRNLWLKRW